MLDEIIEFSNVMKRLKDTDKIQYFEQANALLQKYTGTLRNHVKRTELLIERYKIAEQMALYKKRCNE